MKNQHKQHTKIKGYRDLTQEEIDLVNKIKNMGTELEKLLEEVENTFPTTYSSTFLGEGHETEYYEWWTEARLSLKKGLMFLVRAVAKPTSF